MDFYTDPAGDRAAMMFDDLKLDISFISGLCLRSLKGIPCIGKTRIKWRGFEVPRDAVSGGTNHTLTSIT